MTKEELKTKIEKAGDAVVTFRSINSKKLKYSVVTVDFSSDYVKAKRNFASEDEDTLLTFCWDSDSFKLIKAAQVTNIVPLASLLRNKA